ncbi:GNAT family N-acetyltransferase [Arthrobacter sp. zg-Y1143]|uniref:GNAT family N-acetyltransferase n=1 Tax=Arthrobacter sp. zg-Y1143 TaxID=3049065 RepID=UPI0024C46E06|nr:GNAT family N-acetyltransferase [Arthrobacter sp. zg-Y1143]MDK1326460.1 GNAT family N-acetyltransferase [Arthrobacter sp. zg-Y1143]
MPQLIAPTAALEGAWRQARAEWGPGVHEDGFGLRPEDDVETSAGFSAWLRRLAADTGCTYRWIVSGGQVLGGIALRHGDADAVRRAGNIGYGIRPSARRQGHAVAALRAMLDEARELGLPEVLLICGKENTASARTIERAGGIPAGPAVGPGSGATGRGSGRGGSGARLRKYVISTGAGTAD